MGDVARRCVIPTAVVLSGVIVGAAAVWTSAAPAPSLVLRTVVIHRPVSDAASPPVVQTLAARPRPRVSGAAAAAPAPPRAAAVGAVSRDPAPSPAPAPRTSRHAAASPPPPQDTRQRAGDPAGGSHGWWGRS